MVARVGAESAGLTCGKSELPTRPYANSMLRDAGGAWQLRGYGCYGCRARDRRPDERTGRVSSLG